MNKKFFDREKMKIWFARFQDTWEKHGFAVVLLFCAGIIGVTALLGERLRSETPLVATASPESTRLAVMAALQDESSPSFEWTVSPVQATRTPEKKMIWPVGGDVGAGFYADALYYNATLHEYSTHPAIDILVPPGTDVVCAMDGVVEDVYVDLKLGNVVVLAHEDGTRTGYASLDSPEGIRVGMAARQGMVLAGAGESALGELALGAHLHFFILNAEGDAVNPLEVLP